MGQVAKYEYIETEIIREIVHSDFQINMSEQGPSSLFSSPETDYLSRQRHAFILLWPAGDKTFNPQRNAVKAA